MPNKNTTFLYSLASITSARPPVLIEGVVGQSNEFDATFVILSSDKYLLIPNNKIIGQTPEIDGRRGVFVSPDAEVWGCNRQSVISLGLEKAYRVDEENISPPEMLLTANDPVAGTKDDQGKLAAGKSLEGTCKVFERKCKGGGSFDNNCAHYLSNAFIAAGYSELNQSQDCVAARCNEEGKCNLGSYLNHRVIRAKNLRCWFASKAKKTATSLKKNSGFWATYQERARDGQGHVVIIDTGAWRYYGTGWFPGWSQEYYQW